MISYKCDNCRKDLTDDDLKTAGHIKVSRKIFSWSESWWGRMEICAECMAGLKQIWLKSTEGR